MDMKRIGKNMAALRKTNGYTQETLAEKLGVTPQAVSKWETGLALPEASLLMELSVLLRVTIDGILQPKKNSIQDFMNHNLAAPPAKLLSGFPSVSHNGPPQECRMQYSFPAMISSALTYIEAREQGRTEVTYPEINDRYNELMHVTGTGYGFLWSDNSILMDELWRINEFGDMVSRAMRYYGRNYLWLNEKNTTHEEMQRIIVWSIDHGHPVVTEWMGGLPEFSIVTGYEDTGNTLIGYTYCEECATKIDEYGMYINPARWNDENVRFNVLIIGDKTTLSYSDKDSIRFALEVLDKTKAEGLYLFDRTVGGTEAGVAGDAALRKWLEACETDEKTVDFFKDINELGWYSNLNAILTQKILLSYFKKLDERSSAKVHDAIIYIGLDIERITNENQKVKTMVKDNLNNIAENAAACRAHIENLIKYRQALRGWLRKIIIALGESAA